MKTKKFSCGCEFLINKENRIILDTNTEHINLECPKVWELLAKGRTTGIFQLESNLGRIFSRKLKPANIEQLAALLALLRPGALEVKRDNKSITQHYIDKKNGEEEITYYHSALKEILEPTLGELCYQEQSMFIASKIAGFSLQESDLLRKSIGKKDPQEMVKVKDNFIKGCKKVKLVTEEEAKEVFSWIEKSQRYQFNKSHAISYAFNTLLSCYVKAHFPYEFFTSSLYYAKNKPKPHDEIKALVSDAKTFNIPIKPPSLIHLNKNFKLIKEQNDQTEKIIYFGFINVKGIGHSVHKKLKKTLDYACQHLKKPVDKLTWLELLIFVLPSLNSTAVKAICDVGILSYLDITRKQAKYEYEKYMLLSNKEQAWVKQNYNEYKILWNTLEDCINTILKLPSGKSGACANKKRKDIILEIKDSINNPPYSLKDTSAHIAECEESLFGLPITCTSVEECEIDDANCTCKEFLQGVKQRTYWIPAQINRKKEIITKNNKKMCFLDVEDISGNIDGVVVFPEEYSKFRSLLFEKNNIMITGNRGKTKESLITKKIFQL